VNEIVPTALEGERVDRVIATLTGSTRAAVATAVKDGRVRLDGKPVSVRSQPVSAGQNIEFDEIEDEALVPQAQSGIDFDVVFEDEHLLVVNKPVGLVVHPGAGNTDSTLVNGLLHRFPEIDQNRPGELNRPGIVHRLDAGTTGLLVVSKTSEAHEALVELLKAREIARTYLALACGQIENDSGVIEAPIGRGERYRTKMAVSIKGKPARTSYDVLARCEEPPMTAVRARLETGRTHQIRVHFAAIGHPLVGDRRYNGYRDSVPLDRPFLHAAELAFTHPISGKGLEFEAQLPEDLVKVAQRFELLEVLAR
jgi:23S rRNA pseudouridine1911/1915/1917 synthase